MTMARFQVDTLWHGSNHRNNSVFSVSKKCFRRPYRASSQSKLHIAHIAHLLYAFLVINMHHHESDFLTSVFPVIDWNETFLSCSRLIFMQSLLYSCRIPNLTLLSYWVPECKLSLLSQPSTHSCAITSSTTAQGTKLQLFPLCV